jgi:hypothetical protein
MEHGWEGFPTRFLLADSR